MRVLVTGGTGKAGRFTVKNLVENGHDVLSIDRMQPEPGTLACPSIQVDLNDCGEVYDAFAQFKPDGVCHIAANPSPSGFPRQQTFQNNTMSTYHVMQAAGDAGIKRLIYAGSEMATGWLTTEELPPRIPFNESDRVNSPNAYALAKYLGEVIADSMILRYPEMTIATLRINNIILPDRYDMLAERREKFPGPGSGNFWSYIDVRDVASAFRLALEGSNNGHEVFLIAAADTCIDIPIRDALETRYGTSELVVPDHGDFESAFDCSKVKSYFGWEAQYSWRDQ